MLLDLVCVLASFWIAYYIRHGSWAMWKVSTYRSVCILLLLVDICVSLFQSGYSDILRRGFLKEFVFVCRHLIVVIALLAILMFFIRTNHTISRMTIFWTFIVALILMMAVRSLWKRVIRHQKARNPRQILLAANRDAAERILHQFNDRMIDFTVQGIVLLEEETRTDDPGQSAAAAEEEAGVPREIRGTPVVANEKTLTDYLMSNAVDEIFFASSGNLDDLVRQCSLTGVTIHLEMATALNLLPGASHVEEMAGITVLTGSPRQITAGQAFLKRLLDIVGSLFGLAATGVLFLFVAPAIRIADPGPIFFAQDRVGRNGRVFKLYKFRSMYMDAEERKAGLLEKNEMDGIMFKMENDPRVIGSGPDGTRHGFGHFIRTTSIDEFPQFWNVFIGDMSLVGTRPPTLEETKQYDIHHHARLAVKPGLTGMWQVSGRSDITNFEEVVRLDMEYIRNWSLGLDIRILAKSVKVVLGKNGSK